VGTRTTDDQVQNTALGNTLIGQSLGNKVILAPEMIVNRTLCDARFVCDAIDRCTANTFSVKKFEGSLQNPGSRMNCD
jgi:hypothetical protein